jgi:hypothetical protein
VIQARIELGEGVIWMVDRLAQSRDARGADHRIDGDRHERGAGAHAGANALSGTQVQEFKCARDDEGRHVFGDERFARLGDISVAHVYNLRNGAGYRQQRVVQTETQPVRAASIGVRKAPAPEGRAGVIRIDSVQRGDEDGGQGAVPRHRGGRRHPVATAQTISEARLLPVIEQTLEQFGAGARTSKAAGSSFLLLTDFQSPISRRQSSDTGKHLVDVARGRHDVRICRASFS